MTFVAPSSFPFSQSILFLLAVIVGGAGWTLGPVVGAVVTVVLPELIVAALPSIACCIFGALLLAVLWLAPEGVLGTLARRLAAPRAAQPRNLPTSTLQPSSARREHPIARRPGPDHRLRRRPRRHRGRAGRRARPRHRA